MSARQLALLGHDEIAFDPSFASLQRTRLARGAFVDHAPNWIRGHAELFEQLLASTRWQHVEERIYDKVVQTPRLVAVLPQNGPGHPVLLAIRDALTARYREPFTRISLALYRDGRDSVAWHGDRVARTMPEALVATVSLGGPRRFLLRPHGGGSSVAWQLGLGDLVVMGGTCQRTWQHAIPKVARAQPRIAIMFRPKWAERIEPAAAVGSGES
jgi:alkylated DNA repair dioxygenase AlkB